MRRIMSLVVVMTLSSGAVGQPVRNIELADYSSMAAIREVAVSPDGQHVVYAEARWQDSTDDRKSDLWIVATDGKGKPRRLTSDRAGDRRLRWAADGKSVFTLASRRRAGESHPPYDGKTQVWQVFTDSRAPHAATRIEGGIQSFDLTGNALVFAVDGSADTGDFAALRRKHGKLDYGDGQYRNSVLKRLDLTTWREETLLDNQRFIIELAASPDGKRIALITAPDDRVISAEGKSRVDVLTLPGNRLTTLEDSLWRKQAPSPYAWIENLAWSGDGNMLAFNPIWDAYPSEIIVSQFNTGTDQPSSQRLKRPDGLTIHGYGSPLVWSMSSLFWLADYQSSGLLMETNVTAKSQETKRRTEEAGVVSTMSVSANGKVLVAVMGTPGSFPELFRLDVNQTARLTDVNSQYSSLRLPQVRPVSWKGTQGDDVYGVLELPIGYTPGKPVPLIVAIHGGPTTMVHCGREFNIYEGRTWLAAHGFAVFMPNYRGSTGNSDKFLIDLVGRENDIDCDDILRGVDALVDQGIADPDRLGVMGWSNGGYLTNCLITKTNRFKAASSGAGILDCLMEWGSNDEPAYPTVFKKGFPWQTPNIYHKTSPSYSLDKIKTPTLIHVGANDERCPPAHSRMLYRALKEYQKVPTQLITYPDEPHGLTRRSHHLAKMEWDLEWFRKYVTGGK